MQEARRRLLILRSDCLLHPPVPRPPSKTPAPPPQTEPKTEAATLSGPDSTGWRTRWGFVPPQWPPIHSRRSLFFFFFHRRRKSVNYATGLRLLQSSIKCFTRCLVLFFLFFQFNFFFDSPAAAVCLHSCAAFFFSFFLYLS